MLAGAIENVSVYIIAPSERAVLLKCKCNRFSMGQMKGNPKISRCLQFLHLYVDVIDVCIKAICVNVKFVFL